MEKSLSTEDRVRRAEEIYARRRNGNNRRDLEYRRENINNKSKNLNNEKDNKTKDIALLRKLIVQIAISAMIYIVAYIVTSNNYVFSEDFKSKANNILSYDINLLETYNNIKNYINNVINKDYDVENIDNIEEANIETIVNEQIILEETVNTQNNNEVALTEEEIKLEAVRNTTTYIVPLSGIITSPFGIRVSSIETVPTNHTGVDIAADTGTKIVSSTDGEVVIASSQGDYGNHLKIQIGEVSIIYAHCNELLVAAGDFVKQGQEIATVGSTGNSTGPHLHFEIRINEEAINPEEILIL